MKNTKKILQNSAILDDTKITDNDYPINKGTLQDDYFFQSVFFET